MIRFRKSLNFRISNPDSQGATDVINAWVRRQTNDKIPKLFKVQFYSLKFRVGRGPILDFSTFGLDVAKLSGRIFSNQNRYCLKIDFYVFYFLRFGEKTARKSPNIIFPGKCPKTSNIGLYPTLANISAFKLCVLMQINSNIIFRFL